jgi:hypothetical protein
LLLMDLTCFLHDGWEPDIRPASPRRDWMDETPDAFAYRCLPLNIANAHGWEIGAAINCAARWDGGIGVDAVEVWTEPGAPTHRGPVSLFGQGVLTFHVEGIMRTPPGWNLWVGGPPNSAKDGIAPLSGVIETDWSPFTFTMNWRFTRAGEWVTFDRGEAIAFFFPVQRGGSPLSTATLIWPASLRTGTRHVRSFTGRWLTHRRQKRRAHGRNSITAALMPPDARVRWITGRSCASGRSAAARCRWWKLAGPTRLRR